MKTERASRVFPSLRLRISSAILGGSISMVLSGV